MKVKRHKVIRTRSGTYTRGCHKPGGRLSGPPSCCGNPWRMRRIPILGEDMVDIARANGREDFQIIL